MKVRSKFLRALKKFTRENSGQPAPGFLGNIDIFDRELLSGWIKLEDEHAPLHIDIFLNDIHIAKSLPASDYRADVKDAGFSTGHYGFSLDLSDHADLMSGEVRVHLRIANEELVLLSASKTFQKDYDAVGATAQLPVPVELAGVMEPEFRIVLDELTTDSIRGWSVANCDSSQVFPVNLFVDDQFYCHLRNNTQHRGDLARLGISNGIGGFASELRLKHLSPGKHTVSLVAPDGTSISKEVSSGEVDETSKRLIYKSGLGSDRKANLWVSSSPADLAVVVPVYNAADDLRICIDRLARYTPDWVKILFINDASPDTEIAKVLTATEQYKNMRVLHNQENLGFTRTVNRGLSETDNADVIILNSDARVTPGWIYGMRAAALSRPRVATVTAMSDRAGAFSAPKIGNDNDLPAEVDEITYARAFRRRSVGLYPSVPTGNGFCMYISRACMRELGFLDEAAFPRGYGEENDFCMRAGRAGWVNLIDDRTYVFHDRSKSFGDSKTELMEAGREIIDQRYPEYKRAISIYRDDPGIVFARFCASQALDDCMKGELEKTRILYVVSTQTGGTPQTNRDLMGALEDAVDGWLLRCDSSSLELSRLVNGEIIPEKYHELSEHVDPVSHRSHEYDAVVFDWLIGLDPDIVHIRHLGWHGLSLPQISKALDIRIVFSFHDFYTLCPTVKLIDGDQNFCGGVCTQGETDCGAELWPEGSLPRLRDNWVHVWRERFSEVLKYCDAFITTSDSARKRLVKHFPHLDEKQFSVIPHGRDFKEFRTVRQTPEPDERIRILVPGNINSAKGLDVIEALVKQDQAEYLEFHILGNINMQGREPHPRIVRHGKYSRHDFAERAAKTRANVGAIFSIWDETYCHTLTELWSVGLPAMVFDFPTVAGRVRESGAGWVLDHSDITALYEAILEHVFNPDEMQERAGAVDAWQRGYGRGNTTRIMGASYLQVYRRVLRPDAPKLIKIGVVCPQNPNSIVANDSTQVRVWERTHNHVDRELSYIRLHPASLLDLAQRGEIHGAIIQRTAIPKPMVDRLRAVLNENNVPYVMELDDDLLNVHEDKDPTGKYKDYAPFLTGLLEDAKVVTVSTPHLKKKIASINSNAVVIPNLLSERLWLARPAVRTKDNMVRALYMGTKTHSEDLRMVLPALKEIAAQYPMFRLSLIGVAEEDEGFPDFVERIKIPADKKSYRNFVPWLREQSANVDFAIAPLDDTEFNSSKSALKLLEYGALGLPVVASDTVVYREVGSEMPQVELVQNATKHWRTAIASRVAMGNSNRNDGAVLRKWVVQNAMLLPTLPKYDQLLARAISR